VILGFRMAFLTLKIGGILIADGMINFYLNSKENEGADCIGRYKVRKRGPASATLYFVFFFW
jgi:hypothetical protein